jgi:hypothetical protein
MTAWLIVLTVGLLAGTLGGIVGFGSSVILVPVLAFFFWAKAAVPMMAVASLLANLSRVALWWRHIHWPAAAAYAAAAVPASALGAHTLLAMPVSTVERVLGIFLLAMVPLRRWWNGRGLRLGLGGLAGAGAAIGFLTGIVASTGPINAPMFLAFGLVKGAYLSTEALGSAAVYLTKATVFRSANALPDHLLIQGATVGAALMAGAWIAKQIVSRMSPGEFRIVMDGLLVCAGVAMIVQSGSG